MKINSRFFLKIFAAFCVIIQLIGCIGGGLVSKAKSDAFPNHEGTDFEKVLSGYGGCDEKKWAQKELATGEKYVEFTCVSTDPKNIKEAMSSAAEASIGNKIKAIDSVKNSLEMDKYPGLSYRMSQYKYASDRIGNIEGEIEVVRREGRDVSVLEEDLLLHKKNMKEAEVNIEKIKTNTSEESLRLAKAVQEKIDAEVQSRTTQLERAKSAYRDGKLLIKIQWHFDLKDNVAGRAVGVVFDFGDEKHHFDGDKVYGKLILESMYKGVSVLDGLKSIFRGYVINDQTPGEILYFASMLAKP